jgi:hypothetical protein
MPMAERDTITTDHHQYKQKLFHSSSDMQESVKNRLANTRGLVWCGLLFFFLIPYFIGLFKIGQWVFYLLK